MRTRIAIAFFVALSFFAVNIFAQDANNKPHKITAPTAKTTEKKDNAGSKSVAKVKTAKRSHKHPKKMAHKSKKAVTKKNAAPAK